MKNTIIAAVIFILLAGGAYVLLNKSSTSSPPDYQKVTQAKPVETATSTATSTQNVQPQNHTESLGLSSGGEVINAYHFGKGTKEVVFVGGMHGGYEWNTALLAYQIIDYLQANPGVIPANVKVTIVPVLNPDGLSKVVGTSGHFAEADVSPSQDIQVSGRYNANSVDLNRNFDCDWRTKGVWQKKTVSGGSSVFSELETQAIKKYVESAKPAAVIAWFSSEGGVYSSNCHNGVSPETNALNELYSKASGYPSHEKFDYYATTGDMTNWLAKINIPAVSVLLTNHTNTELDKNLAGTKAILQHYAQ